MPTYGYRCQSCDSEFEVLQRMSDPPAAACPACAGAGKRLFYPAGILFKGSGFYKTDSRGSDSLASKDGDGKATPAPATSSDAATAAPAKAAPAKTAAPAAAMPTSTPAKSSSD